MIYLDYNATMRRIRWFTDVVRNCISDAFGNTASRDHRWDAAEAVEEARIHVAELINARGKIVFTSSARESINCSLRGLVLAPEANQALTGSATRGCA
jgi:cysteine desulfurase